MTLINEIVRGKPSGGVWRIVVGDFCKCKVGRPLCGFVSCEKAKILFEGAVCSLCLTVCLWVVGRRETECGIDNVEEFGPELGEEACVSIGKYATRETMESNDIVNEKLCEGRCVGCRLCRDEMSHFTKAVDDNENCIEVVGEGELCD